MIEYKIEKGVPVPTNHRRNPAKYPWPEMEAGDSVLIPLREGERTSNGRAANAAAQWLKRHRPDLRHVCRTVDGGVRIWFVKRDEGDA